MIKTSTVPAGDLDKHYLMPVELSSEFTEDMFDAEWEVVRDGLRSALGARWTEDQFGFADFAVMDDRNNAWTQCGGVYSARICCPEYVAAVSKVLGSTSRPHMWAYHTVVEVDDFDISGLMAFVVRHGQLIIPDDGRDYSIFGSA